MKITVEIHCCCNHCHECTPNIDHCCCPKCGKCRAALSEEEMKALARPHRRQNTNIRRVTPFPTGTLPQVID